jgi:predicted dehydrogenase
VRVASRDDARAEAFGSAFGAEGARGGYAGLVNDPDIDLIYIATHHPGHRRWAVEAAKAGKHVLCEKPLAVHHGDAEDIVVAARAAGVFLMEAFAYRCHPQTRTLVSLLENGTVGEVRVIDAVFGYDAGPAPTNYLMDRMLAGGSVLDVGCYTTSMAHLIERICGAAAPDPVAISGSAVITDGVDVHAAGTLCFSDGTLARIASSIRANLESSVRIYGESGTIVIPSPWLPGRTGTPSTIHVEQRGREPTEIDTTVGTDIYRLEVESVSEAVILGETSLSMMPWEESLANMQTLDRWRASMGLWFGDELEGRDREPMSARPGPQIEAR